MAFILNIETAIDTASVALARNGETIYFAENNERQNHATWLHPAIQEAMKATRTPMQQLDAVAVSNGPGSYTGLRIGLATAKGICYTLGIPLITISTLQLLAADVQQLASYYICPMIDARRMDVFTAVYGKGLETVIEPTSMTVNENSFAELLQKGPVLFTGNGAGKFLKLLSHPNASYAPSILNAKLMCGVTEQTFMDKQFADTAYAEPFYTKSVYINKSPHK